MSLLGKYAQLLIHDHIHILKRNANKCVSTQPARERNTTKLKQMETKVMKYTQIRYNTSLVKHNPD